MGLPLTHERASHPGLLLDSAEESFLTTTKGKQPCPDTPSFTPFTPCHSLHSNPLSLCVPPKAGYLSLFSLERHPGLTSVPVGARYATYKFFTPAHLSGTIPALPPLECLSPVLFLLFLDARFLHA